MYKIMVVKQARSNYKSLYQFLLAEDESGNLVPLELGDINAVDEKVESMLNDEGYAKSDFIVVDTVDFKVTATNYVSGDGCLNGVDPNGGYFFDSGYVDSQGYLHLTKDGEEISNFTPFYLEGIDDDTALPAQATLHANCNPTKPEVVLNWSFTDNTAEGIMIRRKQGSMPLNATDGDEVCTKANTDTTVYTDTDYTSESVGTIDNPTVYYYRAFAYNLTKQGKIQYQTSINTGTVECGVYYLENGSTLADIGADALLGMSLIFGRYGSAEKNEITWTVVHADTEQQITYLMLADATLSTRAFDAPETGRVTTDSRYSNGYSRWSVSNIRQFMNSTKGGGGWFEAQHDYDVAPSAYVTLPGFLHFFTTAEINLIIPITHTLVLSSTDGGGTETVVDTVWLPSTTEMGLESSIGEGTLRFDLFTNDAARKWCSTSYQTRTCYSEHRIRHVNSSGGLSICNASHETILPRGGLALPLSSLVQYDADEEKYCVVAVESN